MASLLFVPSGGTTQYRKLLFRLLKPGMFNKGTCEMKFRDNNITLNIHDTIRTPELLRGKPSELFEILQDHHNCWFVFWKDSRKVLQ